MSERQEGETLAEYKTRQLQEHVAVLQSDVAKMKERLMIFFFILLASNVLTPELGTLARTFFPI